MGTKLNFREVVPTTKSAALRVRIHKSGGLAVIVDARGTSDPSATIAHVADALDLLENNTTADEAYEHLRPAADDCLARISVFSIGQGNISFAGNTNATVFRLHGNSATRLSVSPFAFDQNTLYVVSAGNIDSECLTKRAGVLLEATTVEHLLTSARECQQGQDWALLVINPERSLSFNHPAWPYDPFLGLQEDRNHEREGLAAIADALFTDKEIGSCFRIVGGISMNIGAVGRLTDGILVCRYGVVPLELKAHSSQRIELWEGNANRQMKIARKDGAELETSPLLSLELISRQIGNEGLYQLGVDIPNYLRQTSALIFTNPHTKVLLHSQSGSTVPAPCRSQNTLICAPKDLPALLRARIHELARMASKKPQGSPASALAHALREKMPLQPVKTESIKTVLSNDEIIRIADRLSALRPTEDTNHAQKLVHGRFEISLVPVSTESTTHYTVFEAITRDTRKAVWAKRYQLDVMGRQDRSGINMAIQRAAREASVLQDLGRVPGVQGYLDSFAVGVEYFVIIERVEGARLDTWLGDGPGRTERIKTLRALAETLQRLSESTPPIVHRAITPSNIRINADSRPVLVNFDLSFVAALPTISAYSDDVLDQVYLPREGLHRGETLTPACDTYSFGKIACLTLSGRLPFKTYVEQARVQTNQQFWNDLASDCGLGPDQADALKRMLSLDPSQRPTGHELIAIVSGWD